MPWRVYRCILMFCARALLQKPCPVWGDKMDASKIRALAWDDLLKEIRTLRTTPVVPAASGRATLTLYGVAETPKLPGDEEEPNVSMAMLVKAGHFQESYIDPNVDEHGNESYPFDVRQEDVDSVRIWATENGVTTTEVTAEVLEHFVIRHREKLAEFKLDKALDDPGEFNFPIVLIMDTCASHGFAQDVNPPILTADAMISVCERYKVEIVPLPHNTS